MKAFQYDSLQIIEYKLAKRLRVVLSMRSKGVFFLMICLHANILHPFIV